MSTAWLTRVVRSRHTVRLRLAILYGGVFLVLGFLLTAVILVTGHSAGAVAVTAHPGPSLSVEPHLLTPTTIITRQRAADNHRLLLGALIVLLIVVFLSGPVGWLVSGRMLRPLRQITSRARTISAGNLHERLALAGPADEFKELGDTLDDLLSRLETSFEAQRRFVANASHELRTPLTVERTLLQVALADPNASAGTLRATCEELLITGREQERLIDALLELARSERGLDVRRETDLAAHAAEALHAARDAIAASGLELSSDLAPAPVLGDPALLERLIANLVDNAVEHNVDGGRIAVETGIDGMRPYVRVANTGAQIRAEEVEPLFEPFRQLGQQRIGTGGRHHGLGLSIVRAVATAHDAQITALPGPDGGLDITVRFPSA